MGNLRSATDWTGLEVNGITLGQPTVADQVDPQAPPLHLWSHTLLPDGVIGADGTITIDELED
jgi:hypothetical protein